MRIFFIRLAMICFVGVMISNLLFILDLIEMYKVVFLFSLACSLAGAAFMFPLPKNIKICKCKD